MLNVYSQSGCQYRNILCCEDRGFSKPSFECAQKKMCLAKVRNQLRSDSDSFGTKSPWELFGVGVGRSRLMSGVVRYRFSRHRNIGLYTQCTRNFSTLVDSGRHRFRAELVVRSRIGVVGALQRAQHYCSSLFTTFKMFFDSCQMHQNKFSELTHDS